MKKIIKYVFPMFSLVLVFLFIGVKASAVEYVCAVEVHSFTITNVLQTVNYTSEDETELVQPMFSVNGHSYAVFTNLTSSTIQVGYYSLGAYEEVSVGLWQTGSIGGSSSGSSINGNHNGVYYNLEKYKFGRTEMPSNDVYLTKHITLEQLEKASDRLISQNDKYNALTYNCSALAVDMWNYSTGDKLSAGWINTPDYLRSNIINHANYPEYYGYNHSLVSNASYYDTNSNSMVTVW